MGFDFEVKMGVAALLAPMGLWPNKQKINWVNLLDPRSSMISK